MAIMGKPGASNRIFSAKPYAGHHHGLPARPAWPPVPVTHEKRLVLLSCPTDVVAWLFPLSSSNFPYST